MNKWKVLSGIEACVTIWSLFTIISQPNPFQMNLVIAKVWMVFWFASFLFIKFKKK